MVPLPDSTTRAVLDQGVEDLHVDGSRQDGAVPVVIVRDVAVVHVQRVDIVQHDACQEAVVCARHVEVGEIEVGAYACVIDDVSDHHHVVDVDVIPDA
eukprot:CAMPEP_0197062500 /NCGR_PEP_ID=MMETSP1384-20130603/145361_1 /TAXON_ID=29189 /ORGANISM="Ammonia sp." /LENGTH=97 /DNA_ID=CAMNT_0042498493 /DNA_START=294 /DNA_END=584 /DNA_ORIENTATION=-